MSDRDEHIPKTRPGQREQLEVRKGVETEGLEEHDDGGVYEEELERETIRKTKKTKEAVYEGQDEEAGKDEDEEDKESSCQERL